MTDRRRSGRGLLSVLLLVVGLDVAAAPARADGTAPTASTGAGSLTYEAAKSETLRNTHWFLDQYDHGGVARLVQQGADLTVHGDALRVRDGDGCDTLTARVTTTTTTVTARDVDPGNTQCIASNAFAAVFHGTDHYTISSGRLFITDAGGDRVVYDDAARTGVDLDPVLTRRPTDSYPRNAHALTAAPWTLTALQEQGKSVPIHTAELRIHDHELTISGVGTTGRARVRTWADAFRSGRPRTVHEPVGRSRTTTARVFADLLSGETAFWRVRGRTLTVEDGYGIRLTFRAAVRPGQNVTGRRRLTVSSPSQPAPRAG